MRLTVCEFARPSNRGLREMGNLSREVFGKTYAQTSIRRVA